MTQLNITLNQKDTLQLLSKDRDQGFYELLKNSLNSILLSEFTAKLKMEPYDRSNERSNS